MLSFSERNIDTIVNRGTGLHWTWPRTDSLKSILGPDDGRYNRSAVDLGEEKVMISGVEITGVDDRESLSDEQNRPRRREQDGAGGDRECRGDVYGTNAFDYVTCRTERGPRTVRPARLCEGPIHQVGVGTVRYGRDCLRIGQCGSECSQASGSSVDFTAKVGTNPYANLNYSFVTRRGTSLM